MIVERFQKIINQYTWENGRRPGYARIGRALMAEVEALTEKIGPNTSYDSTRHGFPFMGIRLIPDDKLGPFDLEVY